jgi:hypothetical protein
VLKTSQLFNDGVSKIKLATVESIPFEASVKTELLEKCVLTP